MKNWTLEAQALEAPARVDSKAGVLRGLQVIRTGNARGHDLEIDGTTLDQVVSLGNAAAQGVKSRAGHPNVCNPGFGTAIGRMRNFRRDGNAVYADLHFSEAAPAAARAHIEKVAAGDPGLLGVSIVFAGDEEARRGHDDNGDPLLPLARLSALHAADIVDDPAATDSLFGEIPNGIAFDAGTMIALRSAMGNPEFVKHALTVLDRQAKLLGVDTAGVASTPTVQTGFVLDTCLRRPALQSPTKEYPRGLMAHALEHGMAIDEFCRAALELNEGANTLALFEEESAQIPVESFEAPTPGADIGPTGPGSLENGYFARFLSLGYPEEQARRMASEAVNERN